MEFEIRKKKKIVKAEELVEKIKRIQEKVQAVLKKIQKEMKRQVDRHRGKWRSTKPEIWYC